MKFNALVLLLTLLITTLSFSQTTYFIKYKENVSIAEVDRKVVEQTFSDVVNFRQSPFPDFDVNYLAKGLGRGDDILGRIVKIQFAENVSETEFTSLLSADPDIEYMQKANTYQANFIPNDSLLAQQWALDKIKAFDAWDITTGSDTVLLAIIDTGIEYFHPDLQNKIFFNPGEMGLDQFGNDKRFNGIDDDGNGFIDDYMGWDFVDRVGVPFDTSAGDFLGWDNYPYDPVHGRAGFHGTFVGGIAGAEANNGSGIAGAAPNIKLLNIRSFDNLGLGEEDDAAAAILYAVKMGAKVINMSWGDYSFSYVLRDVIRYAYSNNVVLVASSGNSLTAANLTRPHYPSGYTEVISVGNSTISDTRASTSVYGSTLDLMAPGTDILSTWVNSGYDTAGGTSASAPLVAATAALILSLGDYTNEEVKQIIKSTCDDIYTPGWDIQTGSGRLNMQRALNVIAPSNIKFHFPFMDYATDTTNISITATVLSAYFVSYSLTVGKGIDPTQWITLIDNGLNQFIEAEIYDLDISDFEDGTYTLRLIVNTNGSQILEERTFFHVVRTPPQVIVVGEGPVYYGDRPTILAEIATSQLSIVKLYYRKLGSSEFDFITLDGFLMNNQFVKQLHYGFIPKELAEPSTFYEVYYEAVNLAGYTNTVLDTANNLNYFLFQTEEIPFIGNYIQKDYSLPRGILFSEPVSFLSDNFNEILFQTLYTSQIPFYALYQLNDNSFEAVDSIEFKIPRQFGDFNNNNLKDLMSVSLGDVKIDEQINASSFNLQTKYSSSSIFNPVIIEDLSRNGEMELISAPNSQNMYIVSKLTDQLKIDSTKTDTIRVNTGTTTNLIVVDTDSDGRNEIWFIDQQAMLRSYIVNNNGSLIVSDSLDSRAIAPGLVTINRDILTSGDYTGDGQKELAILYETNSIAPTFFLIVFKVEQSGFSIVSFNAFLDQSAEYIDPSFGTNFYKNLKFADLDNDGKDELIMNIYPYVYVLKYDNAESRIIFFDEGVNTPRVFTGDLDQNGLTEMGLSYADGYKFFEIGYSNRTIAPVNIKGFSIDENNVQLSWNSNAQKFYIYKGTNASNIELIDSTFEKSYLDNNVELNTEYFYSIQAYDAAKPEPLSTLSKVIQVYSHKPAEAVAIVNNSSSSVIVTFSDKMKNTIENLQSFEIIGMGFPNSVSPSDQFSYLLSFSQPLPDGENKLFISKIRDFYNSPVPEDTISFIVTHSPDLIEFYVSSFEIMNPYMIKVVFNFPVDEQSALNTNNYSFEPDNKVSNVIIDENDNKIVYLDLRNQKPVGSIGREYVLRIENVLSDASMGNILIKSGAGSYIVLTGFAPDLSDVYVYPNPVKAGESQNAVTFANLPRRAKITIWDINGVKINEIEERDGNGGVDYNLTNQFGERISTGIYIYRVVMIDDQNNEGEEKLGKFAVIK